MSKTVAQLEAEVLNLSAADRERLVEVLLASLEDEQELEPAALAEAKRRTEEMDQLDRLGATVHVRSALDRIGPSAVRFIPEGGHPRELPADLVVLTGIAVPDSGAYDALAARLPDLPVRAIGDGTGLGLARGATEGAARVVHELTTAWTRADQFGQPAH